MLSDETMVFQQLFKIRAFCLFQSLLVRDFLRQAKRQIGDGFFVPNLYSGVVPGRMSYVLPQTSGTPMRYSFRSVAAKLLKSPGKRLLKRGVGTHCL